MDLETGFYWISEGGADPEVASWTDDAWWTPGSETAAPTRLVTVLSERLRLPQKPLRAVA